MKIEKVNDRQIRCTLTSADLAERRLKLSELAYGTEKARNLFRDMMQQASQKFGFETDNLPLMIEAIPINADTIVLLITKVDDPEELDTRFSKFAPGLQDSDSAEDLLSNLSGGADDILDLFRRIHEERMKALGKNDAADSQQAGNGSVSQVSVSDPSSNSQEASIPEVLAPDDSDNSNLNLTRIYSFESLRHVIRLAHIMNGFYQGANSLFRDPVSGLFLLLVSISSHTAEDFNRFCNCASEYGHLERETPAQAAYLMENCELLLPDTALQTLEQF